MTTYNGTAITTNATRQLVGNISAPRKADSSVKTLGLYGSFGGGTAYFETTRDDVTFSTVKDPSTGTVKNFTASDDFDIIVGAPTGADGKFYRIYVTMSGATSPNVIPSISDIRG